MSCLTPFQLFIYWSPILLIHEPLQFAHGPLDDALTQERPIPALVHGLVAQLDQRLRETHFFSDGCHGELAALF